MATDLVNRRTALKYTGLIALIASRAYALPPQMAPRGYGVDPDLSKRPVNWPRTLSSVHLATLKILADIILPAEPPHRTASAIGVHEFLDEWVSAPYPEMLADRSVFVKGITALDDMTRSRHKVPFRQADPSLQVSVFDEARGAAGTARFARRLIELVCAGYYTTREGHAAIGYVGNLVLTGFPGTPPEIVSHLNERLRDLR